MIKAWADGAEIQEYVEAPYNGIWRDGDWRDVDGRNLDWHPEVKYRIKPKEEFLKFRNALLKFHGSIHIHTYYPEDYERIEKGVYFVKWIGEEQTVNIEPLR